MASFNLFFPLLKERVLISLLTIREIQSQESNMTTLTYKAFLANMRLAKKPSSEKVTRGDCLSVTEILFPCQLWAMKLSLCLVFHSVVIVWARQGGWCNRILLRVCSQQWPIWIQKIGLCEWANVNPDYFSSVVQHKYTILETTQASNILIHQPSWHVYNNYDSKTLISARIISSYSCWMNYQWFIVLILFFIVCEYPENHNCQTLTIYSCNDHLNESGRNNFLAWMTNNFWYLGWLVTVNLVKRTSV